MGTARRAFRGAPLAPAPLAAAVRWALFAGGVVLLANWATQRIAISPSAAFAPALLIAAGAFLLRAPVVALGAAAGATGAYGTIVAFTPIPPSRVIELAVIGMWAALAIAFARSQMRPVRIWPGFIALCVLVFVSALMAFGNPSNFVAWRGWRETYLLMSVAIPIALIPWGRRTDMRLARALVVVALLAGIYAIYMWIAGPSAKEQAYADLAGGNYNITEDGRALFGPVGDRHLFSNWLAISLPFLTALALVGPGARWRLAAAAAAVACMAAEVGTDTRSGLAAAVGGIATVLVLVIAARATGPRRFVVALLSLAVVVTGSVIVADVIQEERRSGKGPTHVSAIFSPTRDKAFQERVYQWESAFKEIGNKPFGHGIGTGGALAGFSRFQNTAGLELANSYLKVAFEQGAAAAVYLIITLLLLLVGLVHVALATARRTASALCIAAGGTLVAFGVQLNFEAAYIETAPVALAFMIIGLGMRQATQLQPDPAPVAAART